MRRNYELRRYRNAGGRIPYSEWLGSLDHSTAARIGAYVDRMKAGNFGTSRSVGGGVTELKIDTGPGYRVYYLRDEGEIVVLLCGGDLGAAMKKRAASVSHEAEEIREFRKNPKLAHAYLNAAIEVAFKENDPELVLTALAVVAKAAGMSRVARKAELRRESLHRMLSKRGNPEWNSLFRVMRALDLRPSLVDASSGEFAIRSR